MPKDNLSPRMIEALKKIAGLADTRDLVYNGVIKSPTMQALMARGYVDCSEGELKFCGYRERGGWGGTERWSEPIYRKPVTYTLTEKAREYLMATWREV